MDGSFENWLEDRGPRGCLIHMVDDATSTSLATFEDEETTWGVADTLRKWVVKYGIPRALYVDWKSVYHQAPTRRQREEGIVPISQFGRMCRKLGIDLIGANSPQAKGRVERGHGTHQDRLIKKMRLKQIRTYEAANAFLADGYLTQHNGKYAVGPREAADFHAPLPPRFDLEQVFCLEEERTVSSDWVVQYGKRWLQIEEAGQKVRVARGASVTMRQHRDGSLSMWLGATRLLWHEVTERPRKPIPPAKDRRIVRTPVAAGHPWRQAFSAAQKTEGSTSRDQPPQTAAG
jgi:hypothetical protein